MSAFITRRTFELYLKDMGIGQIRFEKGCMYKGLDLKGVEGTGIGGTIEEILLYLEQSGYITIISGSMHEILKSLLCNRRVK